MGLPPIRIRDHLESTGRVETRRKLISDGFVVKKTVHTSRMDCAFVQLLSLKLTPFDARDLSPDKSGLVLEILWALRRPHYDLLVMSGQSLRVTPPALGIFQSNGRRAAKRGIEMIFGSFDKGDSHRKQWLGPA
jgi:hypothetical protein